MYNKFKDLKFWVLVAAVILFVAWLLNDEEIEMDYHVLDSELGLKDKTEKTLEMELDDTVVQQTFRPINIGNLEENITHFEPIKKKGKKPGSKGESECLRCLEEIYGVKFQTGIRPSWLKNTRTGHNLEIDCYNDDLKLGLEYNGRQHTQYVKHFHKKGQSDFEYQIAKDLYKKELCKLNNVWLINIDYDVPICDIYDEIVKQLPPEDAIVISCDY